MLAGFGASLVVNSILGLVSAASIEGAEKAGAATRQPRRQCEQRMRECACSCVYARACVHVCGFANSCRGAGRGWHARRNSMPLTGAMEAR